MSHAGHPPQRLRLSCGAPNTSRTRTGRAALRALTASARVATVALLLALFTTQSRANTFVALGPQQYVQTAGEPTLVTQTLNVLDPAAAYTLRIDGSGVTDAVVTLNGVAVFGSDDFGAGVAQLAKPVTLLATNQLTVELRGQPGEAMTLRVVGADDVPPTITASVSPAPNAAGWHNTTPTVTFHCADATSGIASCTGPVNVTAETNGQTVSGTAVDQAGNTATASVTLKLDRTPPVISLTSHADGSKVFSSPVALGGTATDALSGVAGANCNGVAAVSNEAGFTCAVSPAPGVNTFRAEAVDAAGNSGVSSLSLTYAPAPSVNITTPTNLVFLNISPTTVTGTVDDPTATVTVNAVAAPVAEGRFSATLPLAEGPNVLTATATTAARAVGTASIAVTLDTTPPRVTVTTPPDGFSTAEETVSVAGNVNDIVVGTVNEEQAQVTVNGVAAQISNRMFLAANVPLVVGSNVIQAVGRDRTGNAATTQITVTRKAPAPSRVRPASGNNQAGAIGSILPESLAVAVTDSGGGPLAGKPVIFKVTQNNGLLSAGGPAAATVIATTDEQGRAQAQWTLGTRAGAGGNAVEAYTVGVDGTVIFTATGTPGAARPAGGDSALRLDTYSGVVGKIVVDTGNDQTGEVNKQLPKPLIAVVVDGGNNRLAGVPVTFEVKQGGGGFGGQSTFTVNTDSDGRAAATLTLGPQEGNANNLVTADFASNQGSPANFTASGRAAGDPSKTTISGVVLDNSNAPIPGVTVRAVSTNLLTANSFIVPSLPSVQTDAQGQFTIAQAPVGYVKLLVDGSTAQRPGTYPTLDYDLVTVAGQNNTVGMPIFLLPLSANNKLCVTATAGGGTLTIPEAPGFSLTFGPGQVTFPGGSKEGCVSVTVVHGDKVPMVPGFGQQPRFIVTIQPAGAVFSPPAAITMPNVDGLAPREVTEMYSFDHDIGSFVAIGTATVSDDGQVIRSNPGVGVIKAGWHCGGNPAATGSAGTCPDCKKCRGAECVADASQDGETCKGDQCKHCKGGACVPIPLKTLGLTEEYTFGVPASTVEKINDSLKKLRQVGVVAELKTPNIGGQLYQKECCSKEHGKGVEVKGSVKASLGSISGKGKIWPPGPIPSFEAEVVVSGLAKLEVDAIFMGGVFMGLEGGLTGEIGYKKNPCSEKAADREGCIYGNVKTTLTPSLSAEFGGQFEITYDCIFCKKTTITGKASLVFGEFSWPLEISGISFKEESCDSGWQGGLFQPGTAQIKMYAHFAGSWEPENGPLKEYSVKLDFVTCDLTLDGITCR
ncbi:MAG: hypothetical protein ABW208_05775 [Pyrinomonadaceae bacterium]